MSKPVVFLGSSAEQIPIVRPIQSGLRHDALVRPWTSAFSPGETTIGELVTRAGEADFALFIFGPDDQVESRSTKSTAPRDNVIFEAGLFGGTLGMQRTIIVHDEHVKLPTDLLGLTLISYDATADPIAEGHHVCNEFIQVIQRLGWRGSEGLAGQLAGHWWQFALDEPSGHEPGVLSLIRVDRHAPRLVSLSGQAWTADGKAHARFRSLAANLNEETKSLFYYWEGDWPGQAGAPEFFGKGEIRLEGAGRANGYFTVHSDRGTDPHERKATAYLRAHEHEVTAMMPETTAADRKAIIAAQLERRRDLVFS